MEIRPVTPELWDDLVALAERPGPRGGGSTLGACWCTAWRERLPSRSGRKALLQDLVESGSVPGLLLYKDDEPVGWVSLGPRDSFGALMRSRLYGPHVSEPDVWSLVCFYLDPRHRGQGLSDSLLQAAIAHAREHEAAALEVYPKAVMPEWRAHGGNGSRLAEMDDFMGRLPAYARSGFGKVRTAGKRQVMRLELRRPGAPAPGG